jgi:hypothetical protein
MDATKVTIEKSTFVASSVFRDVPVPSTQFKSQQTHMPEAMPPRQYSPVNDLDYSSDDDDIEVSVSIFNRLMKLLYAKELGVTINDSFGTKKEKKRDPRYTALAVIAGLVLVHELVRNRKLWA